MTRKLLKPEPVTELTPPEEYVRPGFAAFAEAESGKQIAEPVPGELALIHEKGIYRREFRPADGSVAVRLPVPGRGPFRVEFRDALGPVYFSDPIYGDGQSDLVLEWNVR